MPPPTRAAADAVSDLYDAEQESLIRSIADDLPALGKCSEHMRGVVRNLRSARDGRCGQLAGVLRGWGESARSAPAVPPDPFFRLLSARFFLLKVGEAQAALCVRYANAHAGLHQSDPEVAGWLAEIGKVISEDLARFDQELAAMGLERPVE